MFRLSNYGTTELEITLLLAALVICRFMVVYLNYYK